MTINIALSNACVETADAKFCLPAPKFIRQEIILSMESFGDFLKGFVDFLGSPWGRLIGMLLSAASVGFSLWALKTTLFYKSSFKAEHQRFLETLWQDTYRLVLTNDDVAKRVAKIFGKQVEETKDDASVLMFINILSSSFTAARLKVVSEDVHASHMRSFFNHLSGDPNVLLLRLEALGYDPDFLTNCRQFVPRTI